MQHFYICRSPGLSAPEQNVMKKVTWQSQCLNILQNTITHCSLTTAQRVQRANIMSLCCVQRLLAQPDWTKSIPQVSLSDLEVWNQKKDRWCWDGERGARQGHNWRWEHFLFSAISPKEGLPQAQLNMSWHSGVTLIGLFWIHDPPRDTKPFVFISDSVCVFTWYKGSNMSAQRAIKKKDHMKSFYSKCFLQVNLKT